MNRKITKSLLTFLIVLVGYVAFAQDGSNDPTFNPIDDGALNGLNALVADAIYQPDGKIIVSGTFTKFGLTPVNYIARLNSDGSLDAGFSSGAGSEDAGYIASTVLQSDGKIVAGGSFNIYNGIASGNIIRLTANGGLDNTFNTGVGANGSIEKVVLQPDGKIIAAGNFTSFDGQAANRIIRLNANGSIDTSFQTGSGANSGIRDMVLQADGKIIASGNFTAFDIYNKRRVVRLNANGSVDTGFTAVYPEYSTAFAVALQADGKIYIGQAPMTTTKSVYRLNSNGSLDSTYVFNNDFSIIVLSLALQQDQKLLVGSNDSFVRTNSDGSIDDTFTIGQHNGFIETVAFADDGKILVGGWFSQYNDTAKPYVVKLNPDGTDDAAFDGTDTTGASEVIDGMIVQPDGKIVITGLFNHYNSVAKRGIARIDEDGSLDINYANGTGANSRVSVSAGAANGKVVIAGSFTEFNNYPVNGFARLNADGTLDTAFNAGQFIDAFGNAARITAIKLYENGKVLVAGSFVTYNGATVAKLCRLNFDGSLDLTFNGDFLPTEFDTEVTKIIELPDSSLLIAAHNTTIIYQQTLFKIDSNGTPVPGFTPLTNSQIREISTMSVQPDGEILVFGTKYESSTFYRKFFRINSDGTPDSSFQFQILNNDFIFINAIHPQSDGKIIIAGGFSSESTTLQASNIARLNADGTEDITFDPGESTNMLVNAVLPQQDKLIIAGDFTSYDGEIRSRIARLNATGTLSTKTPLRNENQVIIFRDNGNVNVNSSVQPVKSVKIFDLAGRLIAEKNNINELSASVEKMLQNNAILIVKVELNDGSLTTKKIY